MKENKVYTKTGDTGFTSLISGERVPKHNLRIKTYGTIDELIAWLGIIRDTTKLEEVQGSLLKIQKQLMTIAAQLSVDSEKNIPKNLTLIKMNAVKFLEHEIDSLTLKLEPLENFIIPGGHILISYAHLARCVCRRAERQVTELQQEASISSILIVYMNRLSDYFFTLSRTFAAELKIEEIKWSGN